MMDIMNPCELTECTDDTISAFTVSLSLWYTNGIR